MTIRPKWFRDICSVLFSAYYLVWANEGDEVVRTISVANTVLSRLVCVSLTPVAATFQSCLHGRDASCNLGKDAESICELTRARATHSNHLAPARLG
jgi:hypothetical protein